MTTQPDGGQQRTEQGTGPVGQTGVPAQGQGPGESPGAAGAEAPAAPSPTPEELAGLSAEDAAALRELARKRDVARRRIEARRKLVSDVVAYLVINAFFIGIWAVTGRGYFWPGWVLAGWGIFLALHIFEVVRRDITDADIDAELRRHPNG